MLREAHSWDMGASSDGRPAGGPPNGFALPFSHCPALEEDSAQPSFPLAFTGIRLGEQSDPRPSPCWPRLHLPLTGLPLMKSTHVSSDTGL